ncbi:hypothetical protein PV08_05134 [Exophiala spinifera]|uniref:NADH:flavin oxidoreductase/NADH oxidase N-terminal domain-containing protein n=1 Tax=Exophiala spinifera TaxID=91928 RepID=A0A0D2C2V2_9EURO|nr:uncharacterized protein PV08_05134 [Exophiala spinifera]KIW17939.1 hypothetical protein PV08_05134 [Exophiala spinifera]
MFLEGGPERKDPIASYSRYKSEDVDVAPLGRPIRFAFAQKEAPNRFLKAAMSERLASWSPQQLNLRGIVSPELINLYRRWGESKLGLILTGNIMVAYDHLEAPGNPVIDVNDQFSGVRFEAFQELARETRKHGSLLIGQVSHPGRQVPEVINPNPISASAGQLEGEVLKMRFGKPRAASIEEIRSIVEAFTHAAEYLYMAGFDGIQHHGAHGYLLSQFISLDTNHPTDSYGGSFQNRARIVLEIAQSVRTRLGKVANFVIGIKLNSVEFQKSGKGITPDECRELCTILETQGQFDFVELSGGTYEHVGWEHKRESTMKREAFFLEFAEAIPPRLSKTKVYVTGGFISAGGMVRALDSVDGIGLGKPVCQEPSLAADILAGKVTGSIVSKIDQNNFQLTILAAGTQLWQVGNGISPSNFEDEKEVKRFLLALETFEKQRQSDTERNLYGFVNFR